MLNHVRWYFNVTKWSPTKDEWLRLTSGIAQEEVDRISKFVYQDDSKSSLIGCALIRKFLSEATGGPSSEPVIIRTKHQRPEVCKEYRLSKGKSWPELIDFNVSHSGDFCVLAGVWSSQQQLDIRVGVDVTKIVSKKTKPELDRFLELMSRREFTRAEWDTVEKAATDRQKCINFTRLWCLKESYIKSIGLGLTFKLDRIDFKFAEEHRYDLAIDTLKGRLLAGTSVALDGVQADDWLFYETALNDEHIVALGYNVISSSEDIVSLDDSQPFSEVGIESLVNSIATMRAAADQDWIRFIAKPKKT